MTKDFKTMIEDFNDENTLYYYQQGFEIGKEEATLHLIKKMTLSNIDPATISEITEIPYETIEQLVD